MIGNENPSSVGLAIPNVGINGGPGGSVVTVLEGFEIAPVPTAFVASTVKVYAVPGLSFETVNSPDPDCSIVEVVAQIREEHPVGLAMPV